VRRQRRPGAAALAAGERLDLDCAVAVRLALQHGAQALPVLLTRRACFPTANTTSKTAHIAK